MSFRLVVLGYHQGIADLGDLRYVPVTRCATFDTRTVQGGAGTRLGGDASTFDAVGGGGAGGRSSLLIAAWRPANPVARVRPAQTGTCAVLDRLKR